jgi:hypothetical protein
MTASWISKFVALKYNRLKSYTNRILYILTHIRTVHTIHPTEAPVKTSGTPVHRILVCLHSKWGEIFDKLQRK